MFRIINIAKSYMRDLSYRELLKLIVKTVYLNDPYLVYMADIKNYPLSEDKNASKINIQKGSLSELENIRLSLKRCPWQFLCHIHDGVEDFFIAKDDNSILHISWIYGHNHHNRLLSLGSGEVEIKHSLTLPDSRGLGIYPRVISDIIMYLSANNTRRVFLCVHPQNNSSIRAVEKAGFKLAGRTRFRKILGVQFSTRFRTAEIS